MKDASDDPELDFMVCLVILFDFVRCCMQKIVSGLQGFVVIAF